MTRLSNNVKLKKAVKCQIEIETKQYKVKKKTTSSATTTNNNK